LPPVELLRFHEPLDVAFLTRQVSLILSKVWLVRDGALLGHDVGLGGIADAALPVEVVERVVLVQNRYSILLALVLLVVRVPFTQK